MEGLTKKQKDILKYIKVFHDKEGFQPTVREIAEKTKTSHSNIQGQLRMIERKGYISLTGRVRGIKFLKSIEE
jgi:SOS-response transcriptional repressor LexA